MQRHPDDPAIRRAALTPAERGAMTSAVLARTTGSACQRALTLLGGQPDGPFDAHTEALVEGHLDHCAACSAIATTLAETRAVLATLVELEPGTDFAAHVVAATSGRFASARSSAWARLAARWAWPRVVGGRASAGWQRMLARPRLSLELAYLATVLIVVIVGNPGLIADALGARANGPATSGVASAAVGVGQPAAAVQGPGSLIPSIVDRALREVEATRTSAARGWSWLVERVAQVAAASWNWLHGLFGWLEPHAPPQPAQTEPARPPVRATQ
jgi:hypothetical protein